MKTRMELMRLASDLVNELARIDWRRAEIARLAREMLTLLGEDS